MKRGFLILALALISMPSVAQVAINTDGLLPDNSAMLDVKSTAKGFLPPRMTTAERNAIGSPAVGLVVFDTDANGLFIRTSTDWSQLGTVSVWGLTGNSGTNTAINFIGTTDDINLIFMRNNQRSGLLGHFDTSFGMNALNPLGNEGSNAAFGSFALASNTTGIFNSALGEAALYSNTTGRANTAIGYQSLNSNISGNGNTSTGNYALYANTTGQANTANGSDALQRNKTGNSNTAIGSSALYDNQGDYNTAIGDNALFSNYLGGANTAAGADALYSNTSGQANTATGRNALYSCTTGNNNTAYGLNALLSTETGGNNTANGYAALSANTTGSFNIATGEQALHANTTGCYNTANGIESLYLATTAFYNTATGSGALYSATGGSNTADGVDALRLLTTGSNNTAIGYNAQVPTATGSNQVRIGNGSVSYAGIQVAWTITSDRRLKTDIKNSELGLGFIKKLNPVSYIRINDTGKKTEYGFIAQEVEETLKNLGLSNTGMVSKDDKGMYSVRYNDLFAPIVKAVQEQQVIIESDKLKIKALEEVNNRLESRLKAIEEKLK